MNSLRQLALGLCVFNLALSAPSPRDELKAKALAGDTDAQIQLGALYDRGTGGVSQSYKEAAKWYELAAKAGDPVGQNNLGSLYLEGSGVRKDYSKALELFRKAAAQGNASAQTSMGYMQEHGFGMPADPTAANGWYRKAAESGSVSAMYNLGQSYSDGIGTAKDLAQAFSWYQKAAEGGYSKAQNNLAIFYENGAGGMVPDSTKALYWYRKAAEQGSIESVERIGGIYATGKAVDKNLIEAYGWLELARTYTLLSSNHDLKWETRGLLAQVMKQLSDAEIKEGNERAKEIWIELYKAHYHTDPEPKRVPTFHGMPREFAQ